LAGPGDLILRRLEQDRPCPRRHIATVQTDSGHDELLLRRRNWDAQVNVGLSMQSNEMKTFAIQNCSSKARRERK